MLLLNLKYHQTLQVPSKNISSYSYVSYLMVKHQNEQKNNISNMIQHLTKLNFTKKYSRITIHVAEQKLN